MIKRLLVLAALCGCAKEYPVSEISVPDVVAGLAAGTLTPVDANDQTYREAVGVVPGAVLLSSFHEYDVSATLPKDKARPLAFYCTSKS